MINMKHLLIPLLAVFLLACGEQVSVSKAGSPGTSAPAPESAAVSWQDEAKAASTLEEAIKLSKKGGEETPRRLAYVTVWGASHNISKAVLLAGKETTHSAVMKDPELEYGKWICTTAIVVKIEADRAQKPYVLYWGVLKWAGKLYSFQTWGPTGTIVEKDQVRFCGVNVGTWDYKNSGGGMSHAVALSGLFD